MKQIDVEIGKVIIGIVGQGVSREIFNGHLIHAVIEAGKKTVMSADGYVMIEEEDGDTKIAIPSNLLPVTVGTPNGGFCYEEKMEKLYKQMLRELEECEFVYDEMVKEEKKESQPWRKSSQKHPAFKRRRA